MDSSFLKEQANRCRVLAENADPFIKRRLLDLAAAYDDRFDRSSRPPSKSKIPGSLFEARMRAQPETGTD